MLLKGLLLHFMNETEEELERTEKVEIPGRIHLCKILVQYQGV